MRTEAAPELLKLGIRQGMSSERADEVFGAGKAMAIASGDARAQVKLLYGLGASHMLSGVPRRAVPLFDEAIAVADPTSDAELRYVAREPLDLCLSTSGDLAAALRVSDEKFKIIGGDLTMGVELIGFSAAWSYREAQPGRAPQPVGVASKRVAQVKGSVARTLRVVLVRDRCAEEGHDAVTKHLVIFSLSH